MFLGPEEVAQLTGRKTRRKQIDALTAMGFRFKVQPDGRPIVLRAHVEEVLGLKASQPPRDPRLTDEPNRDAFRPDWEAMERMEHERAERIAIRKANGDRRRAEQQAKREARAKAALEKLAQTGGGRPPQGNDG
ncbi:MAG: hypothetical protein JWP36_1133 [Paucimonas sp.]|nr:hypothetical protein [Paucimonas sp.]